MLNLAHPQVSDKLSPRRAGNVVANFAKRLWIYNYPPLAKLIRGLMSYNDLLLTIGDACYISKTIHKDVDVNGEGRRLLTSQQVNKVVFCILCVECL